MAGSGGADSLQELWGGLAGAAQDLGHARDGVQVHVVALRNALTDLKPEHLLSSEGQNLCDQRLLMCSKWLSQVWCDMTVRSYQITLLCITDNAIVIIKNSKR